MFGMVILLLLSNQHISSRVGLHLHIRLRMFGVLYFVVLQNGGLAACWQLLFFGALF